MVLMYPLPASAPFSESRLSQSLLPQSPMISHKRVSAPPGPPHLRRTLGVLSPPLSPHLNHATLVSDNCGQESPTPASMPTDMESIATQLNRDVSSTHKTFPTFNFHSKTLTISPFKSTTIGGGYLQSHSRYIAQYSRTPPSQSRAYPNKTPANRLIRSSHRSYASSDTETEFRPMGTRNRSNLPSPAPPASESNLNLSPKSKPVIKRRRVKENDGMRIATASHPTANNNHNIDQNMGLSPDYSPPTSTLTHSKCLKIEWKGQPMDLSNDPDFDLLHPAEVVLASTLRLPAQMYLDSKKRFFQERVNCLKTGKQFRRTDAQKACRIDVNKASRLYAAFEKVGWLDENHFKEFW